MTASTPPSPVVGSRPVRLGPGAAFLRRELGAQAWCVLECLAGRAVRVGDVVVAEASVRAIATDLGIAKNTAHRSLVLLRILGLVEAKQERASGGGFGAGRYRLHLDDAFLVDGPRAGRASGLLDPPAASAHPKPRTQRSRSARPAGQLSLLDG